ncbi:hypothetical protein V2J09_004915 [Rumex salicifolius]
MKLSSAGLLASFLTASTVALSSCSAGEYDVVLNRSYVQRNLWISLIRTVTIMQRIRLSSSTEENERGSSKIDKFAPRFDGLRFIETLITAHR